jgi:hypothetical protein
MASITDTNRNYLELLMQNYPEYKAGLFESTPPVAFEDLYRAPTGPLYDVQPTQAQIDMEYTPGGSWFEEGEPTPTGVSPVGPLHNVDIERTLDILPQNYRVADQIEQYDDESASQFEGPRETTSYAEWQEKPQSELPSDIGQKKFAGNVSVADMRAWGQTHGEPTLNWEGELEPSWIRMQKNLMDLVGTQPTSPRNEQLIDASQASLGWQKPADINKFAAGVLGHEYRHNLLNMPGFTDIRDEVMGTNINKLFANPKSVAQFPSLYNQGIYEAGAEQDMSEHSKEEIFNEVLDMYNQYQLEGNMSGILSQVNPEWTNAELMEHLQKNAFFQYSGKNPNQKFRWGSASSDYMNQMWPLAKKYFAEVDRQGRMGPVNKAKLKVGMPENLSFDTGRGNRGYQPTTRAQNVARTASRVGPGGNVRAYGLASGGLIDKAFSGRSRDI